MVFGLQEVPVFRPTEEEFYGGFMEYIKKIEPIGINYGLAKIIPPESWNPREKNWQKSINLTIPSPIQQQVISGPKGVYQIANMVLKQKTLTEFQELAEKASHLRNATTDDDIERRFWKTVRYDSPIYGADMEGSIFPPTLKHWNVNKLDSLLNFLDTQVQGVNTSYLYFGMWKAMFTWHTEDMDLFSINFLHFGEPKKWYCVAANDRAKFEEVAKEAFPDLHKECAEFLRHKTSLLSPTYLKSKNVHMSTMVQREREIMVTFPGSYHCGFNYGFNCAESVNFATETWIKYGIKAKFCTCRRDTVRIFMRNFVERYKSLTHRDVSEYEEMLNEMAEHDVYEEYEEEDDDDPEMVISGDDEVEDDAYEENSSRSSSSSSTKIPLNKPINKRRKKKLVQKVYSTRGKRNMRAMAPPSDSFNSISTNTTSMMSNSHAAVAAPLPNVGRQRNANFDAKFMPLVSIDLNALPSLMPTTCIPSVLFTSPSVTNV